jgi:hypothetical protein
MVKEDLQRLFKMLLDQIGHETSYRITPDDYTRFDALVGEYGKERVVIALSGILGEEPKIFPSVEYVRGRIDLQTH